MLDASRADQLIEQNVGDGTDQRQAMFLLPNHFVTGGERNHLLHLKAHGDGCAIRNKLSDRIAHGAKLRHLLNDPSILAGAFP